MQSGELTVTGKGSSLIPLSGKPREVIVRFKNEYEPIPCNPHHHDHLKHKVESEEEDVAVHHHHHHLYHDRLFFLFVEWEVHDLRSIEWIVLY